jgi:hypothetical protein
MTEDRKEPLKPEPAQIIRGRGYRSQHVGKGGILIEYLVSGLSGLERKHRDQKKFFHFLGKAARDREINEAIASLRDAVIRASLKRDRASGGIIVALSGVQGGEGTSFLSILLSISLGAFTHRRVAFLDSRFNMGRFDALSDLLGLAADSFNIRGTASKILGYYKVAQPNVYFLKGDGIEQGMEFFSDKQLHLFFDDLRLNFDFTVIDMPPLLREPTGTFIAPALDRLYLVVQAGKTRSRDLGRLLDVCRESRVEVAGVVMNRQRAPLWSHLFGRDFFFSPRLFIPPPSFPPAPEPPAEEYYGEPPFRRPPAIRIPDRSSMRIEGPRPRREIDGGGTEDRAEKD